MTRARLAAVALAAALAACGKSKVTPPGVQLRQPVSIAPFRGITIASPQAAAPYFAIANESRNEVSIVNALDDQPILAPVQLRTLAVPMPGRPTLVLSAPMGQGPDLLVAVAAGDSRLQLVRTWTTETDVVDTSTVDTTGDILAAVAFPAPAPDTARIVLALSGRRIAVVDYARSTTDTSIVPATGLQAVVSAPFAFQPVALAAVPGDPTRVYAASPDPLDGVGTLGVAAIDVSGATPTLAGTLDARGPTRLVAAARLRERITTSGASDKSAFDFTALPVVRVYAVLDESGCGPSARIDCGVAVLDPDPTVHGLPPDPTGRMPYLAPIPLPARVLALAASQPPAVPPSQAPEDAQYAVDSMRLWPVPGPQTTTAVGAAACDNGLIYFLDLGRWKVANDVVSVATTGTSVGGVTSQPVSVPATVPGAPPTQVRIWVVDPAGVPADGAAPHVAPADVIGVTPGWTRTDTYTVLYQGAAPDLVQRRAEAGTAGGAPWLALQVADHASSPPAIGEVVRLWDPGFFVRAGDIAEINAAGIEGCIGTEAPAAEAGTTPVFWARIAALLQPTADFPGGAVQLEKETVPPSPLPVSVTAPQAVLDRWGTCFDQLAAQAATGPVIGLTATIRVGDFSITGDQSGFLGHAQLGVPFVLQYPATANEDTLPACPLDPWPTDLAATACDATCRSACEAVFFAKRTRRIYNVAEVCESLTAQADVAACTARWGSLPPPSLPLPNVYGPVLTFRLGLVEGIQPPYTATTEPPRRGMSLRIPTSSGAFPASAAAVSGQGALAHPTGIATFDRSTLDPPSGYRFLVPYSGDFVIDTTPSAATGGPPALIK